MHLLRGGGTSARFLIREQRGKRRVLSLDRVPGKYFFSLLRERTVVGVVRCLSERLAGWLVAS